MLRKFHGLSVQRALTRLCARAKIGALQPKRNTESSDHKQQQELRHDLPNNADDDVHRDEKTGDHGEDDPFKSFGVKPVG